MLVPVSLLPLLLATVLVVFGRVLSERTAVYLAPAFRPGFSALALALRWIISLAGVTRVTASIYHVGIPVRRIW